MIAERIANDKNCITELLRLGFTEGAVQHFDWRYEHYLTTGYAAQAEQFAEWFKAKLAE